MNTILDKKQMTEEDIKLHYITPAIQSSWGLERITMETKITDGRINLRGNLVARGTPKKADYVYISHPISPLQSSRQRIITTLFLMDCSRRKLMPP